MAAPSLARADSGGDESAKARFNNTKALFEQLEMCGSEQLPSFYSPRLQRSVTVPHKFTPPGDTGRGSLPKDGPRPQGPPIVPPKPLPLLVSAPSNNVPPAVYNKFQQSFVSNTMQKPIPMLVPDGKSFVTSDRAQPGSPLTQVSRHFSQLSSELDRITNSSRSSQATTPNGNNDGDFEPTTTAAPPLLDDDGLHFSNNTFPKISTSSSATDKPVNNGKGMESNFTPYWRDPSYYKRRCGVETSSKFKSWDEENRDVVGMEDVQSGIQRNDTAKRLAGAAVHRDNSTSFVLVRREQSESKGQLVSSGHGALSSDTSPDLHNTVNTPTLELQLHPGLSPEKDALNRKVSFSTAPIKVFKTHGIDEYDRRNEEIDPVASCAEYELERRLDKMELFDVELVKGPEGLGVSIIGMGVGADSGLEKLGIFVKSITPGGAVHKDGRIHVCDQIVSVDGVSLVGVSQLFAAQTLRATGAKVTFTIGREASLEDSEVAQLIQQSLAQDRLKSQRCEEAPPSQFNRGSLLQQQQAEFPSKGGDAVGEGSQRPMANGKPPPQAWREAAEVLPTTVVKEHDVELVNGAKRAGSRWMAEMNSNELEDDEAKIKFRIEVLERELNGQLKKADQMQGILDNTRLHYSQLENKYDQARDLLKNYQEREKEMLEREEVHVEQLREKDAQYSELIGQMRKRIEELEIKLEQVAKRRVSVVEGELNELRDRLAAYAGARPAISQLSPPTSVNGGSESYATGGVQQGNGNGPSPPLHSMANGSGPPRINLMHAGMTKRLPLSAAPAQTGAMTAAEYERMIVNGVQIKAGMPNGTFPPDRMDGSGVRVPLSARSTNEAYAIANASGECSPVPRVSEPASPALPPKFHQRHKILFPIRRHYQIPAENEFWREDVEAQGLRVLSWDVDEVCQLLIHIGLDRYIPEFTVNSVSGPKFLELDGSKLKAMGIYNHTHRSVIKKKVKAIRSRIEKERKLIEKESRERSIAKM